MGYDVKDEHVDFNDASVFALQEKIDCLGKSYIRLFGHGEVTNYFHLLFAGNIRDYLLQYIQGWEALNSLVKQYVWRRTPRGGAKNGGHETIVTAISRFASRMLLYGLFEAESLDAVIKDEKALTKK